LARLRQHALHGEPLAISFEAAAARYVQDHQDKVSLETEVYMLQSIMPHIGHLDLRQVHDATLAPYIKARLSARRKHKTINLALGVVRRVLNLAATRWRDDRGQLWLASAPRITLLPLAGHQRPPRPISWAEQRRLLPLLPDHLAKMALLTLNTGARDDVVCSLQWAWEIPLPELGVSVFDVPAEHVKGRRAGRLLVCNSVAQSVIEAQRGKHATHVFTWRGKPIGRMSNTGWQRARATAGLGDLHVHDLRHTVGMRLREAGAPESTAAELLWHSRGTMTAHYSMAQIIELHRAIERITAPSEAWNKSLDTLRREAAEARARAATHPKVTQPATLVA